MTRMLIMAGGTGGHVIPALAVAREMMDREVEVAWLGSPNSLEQKLVGKSGIPFFSISIKGLRKSGWKRKMVMPLMLFKAIMQSLFVFWKFRPDGVLGMGGFVAGPGGLVAAALKKPLILHEQNSVERVPRGLVSPLQRPLGRRRRQLGAGETTGQRDHGTLGARYSVDRGILQVRPTASQYTEARRRSDRPARAGDGTGSAGRRTRRSRTRS